MTVLSKYAIRNHGLLCRIRRCTPEGVSMGMRFYGAPEARTEP